MTLVLRRTFLFVLAALPLLPASLADHVTIRRDTYGVPHILADSEEAAAYGMGWAQAEDHCVEIARRFISARGEQSKYFGDSPESDFFVKRYGVYSVSKEKFGSLSPILQSMMTAYADAFNLYVERHRDQLPAWIPRFDGIDVMAQGRAQITRFAFPRGMIDAIQKKYPAAAATTGGGAMAAATVEEESPWGSNMWAIAPSRSKSGKAMLLGNPHQPWAVLYWEAQVTVPGKINFFGGTFVGSPVLTTGFNEHLGWTHTVNYPDLDDVYVLKLDPAKPDHYLFNGRSMPLTKVDLKVEQKGHAEPARRTYWDSHLGPIVHRTADKVFALKSATIGAWAYAEEWYALSKATSWKQFRAILEHNTIPMFNLTYADVEGNIFYLWNGTPPKRLDDGTDYRFEVPGDTDKYVWTSIHATGDLPQLFDPSGGYVQNCNAPPWWTSLRNPLDPKKYPSYFEAGRPLSLRTMTSLSMLEGQEKFSLEDIQRLKFNTKMLLADRVKDDLIAAAKAIPDTSDDLKHAVGVLERWNNRTDRDSRGGVLFVRFWETYMAVVKQPYARPWDAAKATATPSGLADPAAAVKHLEAAVRWTRSKYGAEDVAWGEAHRIRLGNVDLPSDGGSGLHGLFHVVDYVEAPDGKLVAGSAQADKPFAGGGDGWVMTIEFGKPVRAYSVLAYGETSNTKSPHSTDQAGLFADHQFKPVWFSEADLKQHLERSYRPGQ